MESTGVFFLTPDTPPTGARSSARDGGRKPRGVIARPSHFRPNVSRKTILGYRLAPNA